MSLTLSKSVGTCSNDSDETGENTSVGKGESGR